MSAASNCCRCGCRPPDWKIDSAHPRGGRGLPEDVDVVLNGITPAAITLQQIDVNTSPLTGPATVTLPAQSPISLHFPGYGLALLAITAA